MHVQSNLYSMVTFGTNEELRHKTFHSLLKMGKSKLSVPACNYACIFVVELDLLENMMVTL